MLSMKLLLLHPHLIFLLSFILEDFALTKAHSDGMHLSYDPKDCIENNTHVLVGHEQHALCDSYIVEFVHDATENYLERGKFFCRNFHVKKIPLFFMKVLKLFLFYLPMLV